jgi:hypothetical protein
MSGKGRRPPKKSSYKERNYLLRLVKAIHSRCKLVFMLSAYIDDSGSAGDQPVVAAGGYVIKAEQMRRLENNWREVLEREGLREPFRMSQAESLVGQFSGWDKPRKDRLVSNLIYILKPRMLRMVLSALVVGDYNDIVSTDDRQTIGGPFSLCAGACIASLSNWLQDSAYYRSELVDVFFEKGASIANKWVKLYMDAATYDVLRAKFKVHSILPIPKGSTPLLEPADLIAYEVFKYHRNRLTDPERGVRTSLSALLEGTKSVGVFMGRKQIEAHIRLFKEIRLL